jgi:DNA-binding transcriptional ArsR family regulator
MESLIGELESFFVALSDRTRLEIVIYLMQREKATVQEISNSLKKSQSLISHHLSCLRNCGIVKVTKSGKFSNYSINGDRVRKIIEEAINHVRDYSKSILSCEVVGEIKEEIIQKNIPST